MNERTGELYESIEAALAAGEKHEELVELVATRDQAERISAAVKARATGETGRTVNDLAVHAGLIADQIRSLANQAADDDFAPWVVASLLASADNVRSALTPETLNRFQQAHIEGRAVT